MGNKYDVYTYKRERDVTNDHRHSTAWTGIKCPKKLNQEENDPYGRESPKKKEKKQKKREAGRKRMKKTHSSGWAHVTCYVRPGYSGGGKAKQEWTLNRKTKQKKGGDTTPATGQHPRGENRFFCLHQETREKKISFLTVRKEQKISCQAKLETSLK